MFSNSFIAGMTVCGALCVIIPFAAMIFYKKKNRDVRISSFFIGGAVFIVFALILEQILHSVMLPVVQKNTVATWFTVFLPQVFLRRRDGLRLSKR